VLDLGIDLEAGAAARPANLLTGQVDLGLPRLRDRLAGCGSRLDRQQADLVQLERKMSAKLDAITAWKP